MPSAMANSEKVAISSGVYSPTNRLAAPQLDDVDREVVDERPHRRGVAEQIPERLEAVDDHHRGLLVLDAADDLGERLLDALAPHHGAEIGDDHPLVGDQALVEEGELLHVVDELQRRFGQRRQVEALLSLARLVEEHLQREDGLARARLAGDHVDRAHRQPAAQDPIEGDAARRQARQAWLRGAQFASSARQTSPRARSSGICSSRPMTTVPVSSTSSRPISATSARNAIGVRSSGAAPRPCATRRAAACNGTRASRDG